MTNLRQTSLEAYKEIKEDHTLCDQQDIILNLLRSNAGGFTRDEIHKKTGIMYSSVCGRVDELVRLKLVTDKSEKRKNESGKSAYVVKAGHNE